MNSSPWAKFTTSMMPKISVRPDATSARIMPVTMPLIVWIRIWSNGIDAMMCWRSTLNSQVPVDHGVVDAQLGGGGVVAHGALLHDIDPLAHLQRERDVLLDQQDRHAFLMQRLDDL